MADMALLTFSDLSALSGYRRPADVARWLRRHRIRYMLDKDRKPVTTQDAIERAMIGATKTQPDFSEYEAAPEGAPQARRAVLRPSQ